MALIINACISDMLLAKGSRSASHMWRSFLVNAYILSELCSSAALPAVANQRGRGGRTSRIYPPHLLLTYSNLIPRALTTFSKLRNERSQRSVTPALGALTLFVLALLVFIYSKCAAWPAVFARHRIDTASTITNAAYSLKNKMID